MKPGALVKLQGQFVSTRFLGDDLFWDGKSYISSEDIFLLIEENIEDLFLHDAKYARVFHAPTKRMGFVRWHHLTEVR